MVRYKEFVVLNDLILYRKIVRSKLIENKLFLLVLVIIVFSFILILSFYVFIKVCVIFYGY